jgi:ferric-dicitrate binding protein FerR (iron transport regulator)
MTTRACAKATLVEALRDGRLGPQESASVERHLATCAECGALAQDLERIGAALRVPSPPATPLEHQRARVALLERAALAPASRPPRRRAPVVLLAAAVLALVAASGWTAGRFTAKPAEAMIARHVPRPPRLALGAETTIRSSDDASFERTRSAGVEVLTLARGTLDVTLRALAPGERFVVRTKDAEIDVHGTAFHVEAEDGRIRGVAVSEGTVEVRYAGFSAVIPSGGSWRATGPNEPVAAAPSAPAPPPVATPKVAARAPIAPKRAAPPPEPPVAARAPPAPPAAGPPPAARDFAAAMAAIRRGDYGGAAEQLEAFSAAHAGDARADEADYLRAVALQRAGRNAEAAAAARRYLATRPSGAHRPEAQQIARE